MCKTPSERRESELKWNAKLEQWQASEKRKTLFQEFGYLGDLGPEAAFVLNAVAESAIISQAAFEDVRSLVFRRGCPREVFFAALDVLSEFWIVRIHRQDERLILTLQVSCRNHESFEFEAFAKLPNVTSNIRKRILDVLKRKGEITVSRLILELDPEFSEADIIVNLQQLMDAGRASLVQDVDHWAFCVVAGVSEYAESVTASEAVRMNRQHFAAYCDPSHEAAKLRHALQADSISATVRLCDLPAMFQEYGYDQKKASKLLKELASCGLISFEQSKRSKVDYLVLENGATIIPVSVSKGMRRLKYYLQTADSESTPDRKGETLEPVGR